MDAYQRFALDHYFDHYPNNILEVDGPVIYKAKEVYEEYTLLMLKNSAKIMAAKLQLSFDPIENPHSF